MSPPPAPLRLIDLAVEWPLQYAGEATTIDLADYPTVRDRLGQVDGYLSATLAAVLWFGPAPGARSDPWAEVARLMTAIESEFPGRILADPADLALFQAEPADTLTWVVPGLRGGSKLLQAADSRDRLAMLLDRGVRAVRLAGLVDQPPSPAEDRELTELERSALATLLTAASSGRSLLLDLAGLPARASGEVLTALEQPTTSGRILPIVSLGGWRDGTIAGLLPEDLARLKALGGLVGLCPAQTFHPDGKALAQPIEHDPAGWAIGTGFLGIAEPIEGLGNAPDVLDWLSCRFDPPTARMIASDQARVLIERLIGPTSTPSSS